MSSKVKLSPHQRERSKEFRRLVREHTAALEQADVHRAAGRHHAANGCRDAAEKSQNDLDKHVVEGKQLGVA